MAPQTLLTLDQITNESLRVLENQCVFLKMVTRSYDSAFAIPGAKIGETLRIRLPERYLVNDGPRFVAQPINQKRTTLVVATQKNVGFQFTTAEQTMKLEEFSDLILKPAVSQIASTVDYTVASLYSGIYNSIGTPGTTPSTSEVLTNALALLQVGGAPIAGERPSMAMNPDANAALVNGMKGLFNPVSKITQQFNAGMIAEGILGYDMLKVSQSIHLHRTGTRSTSDSITVNGTLSTQGATTINLQGGTGSATINEGDVFTIGGVFAVNPQTRQSTGKLQQFVCTATNEASGGNWTSVSFQPPIYTSEQVLATVNSFPQDNAPVTFWGAGDEYYPQNLIFFRDALAVVTTDLVKPNGNVQFSRATHNNVSMRIVQGYDMINDFNGTRLDILFGGKVIRPELAVRVWG